MAYVALFMDGGHLIEIGVARYASAEGDTQCESAVVVADQWQNKGLGKRLMRWVSNDSTNQPLRNNSGTMPTHRYKATNVSKSNIELSRPNTNIKLRIFFMSQR
ncbi:GNAT family N-acetyltransferase [Pseudomonas sp. KHB2.9]